MFLLLLINVILYFVIFKNVKQLEALAYCTKYLIFILVLYVWIWNVWEVFSLCEFLKAVLLVAFLKKSWNKSPQKWEWTVFGYLLSIYRRSRGEPRGLQNRLTSSGLYQELHLFCCGLFKRPIRREIVLFATKLPLKMRSVADFYTIVTNTNCASRPPNGQW